MTEESDQILSHLCLSRKWLSRLGPPSLWDLVVPSTNQSTAPQAVSINAKRRGARPNTSGFVGVSLDRHTGRWQAYVTLSNGARKFVGRGKTPAEAAVLRAQFIAEHGIADPKAKAATVTNGGAK